MYSFYMEDVLLPVPPPELTVKIKGKNKTIDLLNLGEINILKDAGLTEFSFEALLPNGRYPFAVYERGFKEPLFYLDHLKQLKEGKKYFRFIVSRFSPTGGFLFETNTEVSLENYTIKESANHGLDVLVGIELKQYKHYATQKVKVISEPNSGEVKVTLENERPAKEPAKSYTVKSGDTLFLICKKELGDGSKFKQVASLNSIPNPNLIMPGQVLRLG